MVLVSAVIIKHLVLITSLILVALVFTVFIVAIFNLLLFSVLIVAIVNTALDIFIHHMFPLPHIFKIFCFLLFSHDSPLFLLYIGSNFPRRL
jgi:hypothetical protein